MLVFCIGLASAGKVIPARRSERGRRGLTGLEYLKCATW